jgi:uncharacterized protein (TIGR02145 family)
MEMYLGMSAEEADAEYFRSSGQVGNKLKEAGNSHWNLPNEGADNSSGFYGLPGGLYSLYGSSFTMLGDVGYFWSSTDGGNYGPWYRNLDNRIDGVNRYNEIKQMGFSVRCILGPGATPPLVTTAPIAGITDTSALCGGTVTHDGRAAITSRGVCWSTTQNPTIDGEKTIDGSGTGSFTSVLTGLKAATTYYVRAYATNCAGTGYGVQISFKTNRGLPTVSTAGITGILDTLATSGGNIMNDGGSEITARGVCWSTTTNATVTGSKTDDGTGTGAFISKISGLSANTVYFVRAYATNSLGTAYGNYIRMTTAEGTLVYHDRTYGYRTIGTQTWMTENLAYLPFVNPSTNRHYSLPRYYVYGYEGSTAANAKTTPKYQIYGVLYNWPAAMKGAASSTAVPSGVQGICPDGWHLPSDAEWSKLENYLGMSMSEAGTIGWRISGSVGGKLKETGSSHWNSPNNGANNQSGFTALPGGQCFFEEFGGLGEIATFWTATEDTDWILNARVRRLTNSQTGVHRGSDYTDYWASVRCVRD